MSHAYWRSHRIYFQEQIYPAQISALISVLCYAFCILGDSITRARQLWQPPWVLTWGRWEEGQEKAQPHYHLPQLITWGKDGLDSHERWVISNYPTHKITAHQKKWKISCFDKYWSCLNYVGFKIKQCFFLASCFWKIIIFQFFDFFDFSKFQFFILPSFILFFLFVPE